MNVTDPQYTQVTRSGRRPGRDILIFPGKNKARLVGWTNGLTIFTIRVASNHQELYRIEIPGKE